MYKFVASQGSHRLEILLHHRTQLSEHVFELIRGPLKKLKARLPPKIRKGCLKSGKLPYSL